MASAWGSSWGVSWGNSWGVLGDLPAEPTTDRGDGVAYVRTGERRARYRRDQRTRSQVYAAMLAARQIRAEEAEQGEVAKPVSKKLIRDAMRNVQGLFGSVADLQALLPPMIAVPDLGPNETYNAMRLAVEQYLQMVAEQEQLMRELDDEEAMLVLAAV